MTVRQQDHPLSRRAQAEQELLGTRQPGDALCVGPFERLDVEIELSTPVIDAVPGKRAFAGAEARGELGAGNIDRGRTRRRIGSGDDLEPEGVIKTEIEQ